MLDSLNTGKLCLHSVSFPNRLGTGRLRLLSLLTGSIEETFKKRISSLLIILFPSGQAHIDLHNYWKI